MAESTLWWIAAGLLVAAELLTGTFYLLMLAIGGVAVLISYLVRRRRPGDPSPRADRSVNLDVGETVEIDDWGADGTAQIRYRGAPWIAVLRPGSTPRPGPHRVIELVGSRLLVEPV